MVNTTYNSTKDKIKKLQSLKCKTKVKFYQNISKYYNGMNYGGHCGNFQLEEYPFSKNAEGYSKK